ncbi:fumarylacetoacetate hydrolase family protein [Corynebacterium bovis]|uniref:fumarylacetoacetate hydrolase family protein n=1 Tax=Corynebacterium bovis TaxID=36808 RepID=UPI00254FFA68|nr:fumarylacetoacetate hydrolase family protein [Corynebacterium bovis]MDK8510047.1 fumarylacetoacetate hydrolase family protein [Corynebacterium bovis]
MHDTTPHTGTGPGQLPSPSTVIAVHVDYVSRARQRGRTPSTPSYFLKSVGSLSRTGEPVARPAGTELLGFEGEIALVIGTRAHRVPLAEAWSHVGAVTAANDVGLYDYRTADKGSNVRSKSRDGFTPLGPGLIDARTVDPTALRVRTWLNGELVQEGRTGDEDLLFPLPQLVADLSQHLTLEPGDVILTGTPAGAGVAVPGDVLEVEVDAPDTPGHPTSGRLRTPVTEGPGDFDPALGALPHVDDRQREDAWGDRAAAGLDAADRGLRAAFDGLPTAGVSAELRRRGIDRCVVEGVRPLTAGRGFVGVARTLRFLPGREDLVSARGGGYNAQKRAFDALREGEVLVIDAGEDPTAGTLGDVLALRARHLGAAGVVTDGGVRDSAAVAATGLPVFTRTPHPAVLSRRHVPWDADLPVACGGTTVVPGDIVLGDDDGVVVVPRDIAADVARVAAEKERQDAWVAARVAEGNPVDGLFPPTGRWAEAWERER